MTYSLVTAPAAPPLSLADAKGHLRVTHNDEDAAITALIDTATAYLERDTGQALIDQRWRAHFDCVPCDRVLQFLKTPVRGIVAVTVYDRDGNPGILDGSDYFVNLVTRPARLRIADTVAAASFANGVEVDFDAGYGTAGTDVPDMLKRAILVLVAHWYEFRGVFDAADQPVSVPALYARLTRHFRQLAL
ncbi:head-tail connector protein [Oricola sp.]|uniref:head-tail connector protein n=1 Tax=Oricola sp. TaxID=1979950 RepID=UPI003BAC389E